MARPPEKITLLEIYDAAGGSPNYKGCLLKHDICRGDGCALGKLMLKENERLVALLKTVPGFPMPIPVIATFSGMPSAKAEVVKAYELGARGQIAPGWSYDLTAFYNDYNRLSTGDLQATTPIIVPSASMRRTSLSRIWALI